MNKHFKTKGYRNSKLEKGSGGGILG